jgi:hypothetical protein
MERNSCRGRRSEWGSRVGEFDYAARDTLRVERFELTLLWQRGEPFDLAPERLAAMSPRSRRWTGSTTRPHAAPV